MSKSRNNSDNVLTVTISGRDIMDKLESQDVILNKIHNQSKITNGRVTVLENRSLGLWISNNIMKFTFGMILIFSLISQPTREFAIKIITKLIGIN